MAKVVCITDTHFGVRGNSLNENMKLFYNNIFFPYLKKNVNQIEGIIHLGDVFHDRRRIDTLTAKHAREFFFEPLYDYLLETAMHLHIICGNHDSYHKDDLETNSLREFIIGVSSKGNAFKIHTDITQIPEWNMILIPWLTKNNREDFLNKIASTKMQVALGHLELSGFNFSKTQLARVGDDPQNFSKFTHVFSGHYHYRHNKGNIFYLGSPTEQTWIDVDTSRGFHIFDTETGELEFIENPYNYFENVKFGEDSYKAKTHKRHYRLYVNGDEKQSDIDKFVNELYEHSAIKVDIIGAGKKSNVISLGEGEDHSIEITEDTPTFIRKFITNEDVADIVIDLYNRAVMEEK